MKNSSKRAIALLITLLFIMLITLSIGIGLKQLNSASNHTKNEQFLLQSSVVLDDVLTLLQTTRELDDINSSQDFAIFLSEASFIPFEADGINVSLKLESARSRFNINSLMDADNKQDLYRVNSLKQFVSNYMVITRYVDILLDAMGGIKEDMSYNSEIFNEKPYLFRDYIVSYKHLQVLNEFYTSYYHEDSLKNIDLKNLFYFSKDDSYVVDLSYATAEVWEMMLGCDKQRAKDLSAMSYEILEDIGLSEQEKSALSKFNTSTFEKFIDVNINIKQDDFSSKIRFEYDIKNKRGSNFVYEI